MWEKVWSIVSAAHQSHQTNLLHIWSGVWHWSGGLVCWFGLATGHDRVWWHNMVLSSAVICSNLDFRSECRSKKVEWHLAQHRIIRMQNDAMHWQRNDGFGFGKPDYRMQHTVHWFACLIIEDGWCDLQRNVPIWFALLTWRGGRDLRLENAAGVKSLSDI